MHSVSTIRLVRNMVRQQIRQTPISVLRRLYSVIVVIDLIFGIALVWSGGKLFNWIPQVKSSSMISDDISAVMSVIGAVAIIASLLLLLLLFLSRPTRSNKLTELSN